LPAEQIDETLVNRASTNRRTAEPVRAAGDEDHRHPLLLLSPSEPRRFRLDPTHLTSGLKIYFS